MSPHENFVYNCVTVGCSHFRSTTNVLVFSTVRVKFILPFNETKTKKKKNPHKDRN